MTTKEQERKGAGLTRLLGLATVACGAACAIPPSSMVGAMLWAGDLGNMLLSHLRIGGPLPMVLLPGLCLVSIVWGRSGGNQRSRPSFSRSCSASCRCS